MKNAWASLGSKQERGFWSFDGASGAVFFRSQRGFFIHKIYYCPQCGSEDYFKSGFSRPVLCRGGVSSQRYECSQCGHRFSEFAHSMSFRFKKADPALSAKIFWDHISGQSNRGIARRHHVSENCVRGRLLRMSHQALRFQWQLLEGFRIKEPVCFDGLENFAGSQYDVNNIGHAIGRESLFIYDFNLATMNRKGRMSEWQREKLSDIEMQEGRYPPRAIRISAREMFKRLHARWGLERSMDLVTDEHFQYRRALQRDLRELKFNHFTVSSKKHRDFQNQLFAVNHTDLLIRQRSAAFSRETISFSKTHVAMTHKYALFMVHKNFMIPQFTKKHVRRPEAHRRSPAQQLGLTSRQLSFEDIFQNVTRIKTMTNRDWRYYLKNKLPPEMARQKLKPKPSTLIRAA